MSFNISYFLGTLPNSFDLWNVSTKLDYYNINLQGFSRLNITTQIWIADHLTHSDLNFLWNIYQDPALAFQQGLNATQEFISFITSPSLWETYLLGDITTAVPQNATTAPLDPCYYTTYVSNLFVVYMLAPAVGVILFLTFFKSRKKMCIGCLWGRPHLIYPVNFVDEHSHRWAYAMVFILITYKVLLLFEGDYFWRPDEFDDPKWMKTFGWTRVFVVMLNVAWMCLVYYPFLACISLRRMILANIMGLVYLGPWVWNFVHIWQLCPFWDKLNTNKDDDVLMYQAVMVFVFDIPVFLSYLILLISYCTSLVINIYLLYLKKKKRYKYEERKSKKITQDPQSIVYLKELMKSKPKESPSSIVKKVKSKVVYSRFKGFHYSPRVICTMVVAALGLFKFGIELTLLVDVLYKLLFGVYEQLEPFFTSQNLTSDYNFYKEHFYIGRWSGYVGIWTSYLLHVIFMIHMIITYRQHVRNYFKGDRSWHFENNSSPVSTMVASLRYSGYQIAYLLYGFLILGGILVALVFAFAVLIALPIKYKYINFVIRLLMDFWPSVVVGLFVLISQMLLAKFCLLQGKGKYMALDNRRFYHNVNFMFFFYNVIVGLFSCLRRILMSLVFGLLLVSRLDRCLMMRGFEQFDSGFKSYLGMLKLEVYHNHPVVKSFVYLLWQSIDHCDNCEEDNISMKSVSKENSKSLPVIAVGYTSTEEKEHNLENGVKVNEVSTVWPIKKKKSKQWRNKWFKAVTLINNPSLHLDLLKGDLKAANKENKHQVRDFVIDRAADVTSGIIVGSALSGVLN